jgi:hypothetical protein
MAYRILLRRDSSENWNTGNPVLLSGEPGYSTDTGELKIGDGVTAWVSLPTYNGIGPTGATGPMPEDYASTGPNEFYGDQTINGSLTITEGIVMNSQTFSSSATVPDGYNASLTGPVTLTGEISVEGSGIIAIL